MDIINWLLINNDYVGVIIGFVVLVVASLFLPSRVRVYVLTAGLAIIAFRVYQITTNKKKLAEADKKLKELTTKHVTLNKELNVNREELAKLNKNLDQVRQKRAVLATEVVQLSKTSGDLDSKRDDLNQQLNVILTENNKLIEEIETRESAGSVFDEADSAFNDMKKAYQ